MIDIRRLLNQLVSIPQDGTLYLLEMLPNGAGLFVYNGNIVYLVPNKEHCAPLSIKTEFLQLETNVFVSAFNTFAFSFENGYYNTIELQLSNISESEENLRAFTNLCLAHATHMQGQEFINFFDSLIALFQLPKEQEYKNLIGLMGELLFIEYTYTQYGIDLSPYWHSEGISSRLDFNCPFANFEVKTTTSETLRFTLKHNQLFSNPSRTYLVAIILEENNSGRTLDELIAKLLESPCYCNSLHFAINIEKEKRRISPSELHHKHFITHKILAYHALDINPFDTVPNYVEDMVYKLNLHSFHSVSLSKIFSK